MRIQALRFGAWAFVLLGTAGLTGAGARATAAEPLRWTFHQGESLKYSLEQKMTMSTKANGVERKSNRNHTLNFNWTVLAVEPSGEARIRHKTERIRMKADEPPLLPFQFDSAETKGDPPGFEGMARILRAEAGAEFTFRMTPTGEIIDIEIPAETLKRYKDAMPEGRPGGGEVNEKAVKENLMQASPPAFPANPIDAGQTWSARPSRVPLMEPPIATLILDRTFTYQGPDPRSPASRLIGVQTTARVEPIPGVDFKITIRKQDGHGTMTLDTSSGHVSSTQLSLNMELVVNAQGQSIEQTSDSSSTMTLQP